LGLEQRVAARLVEEQLQRVGGVTGELAVGHARRRGLLPAVVADLDAVVGEARAQRVDLLVVELELLDGGAEARLVDAPVLVAVREQFVERHAARVPAGAGSTPAVNPSATARAGSPSRRRPPPGARPVPCTARRRRV